MSMVASHLVWLLRTRNIRRRAKDSGQTFDESEEGIQWQAKGIDLEVMVKALFAGDKVQRNKSRSDIESIDRLVVPEDVVPKTVPNAVG